MKQEKKTPKSLKLMWQTTKKRMYHLYLGPRLTKFEKISSRRLGKITLGIVLLAMILQRLSQRR